MDNKAALRLARTAISQQPEQQQTRLHAVNLLTVLAEARQASISEQTYLVYSKALAEHDLRDLENAITSLSRREKRDGETAFPSLGSIEAEVSKAKRKRESVVHISQLSPELQKAIREDQEATRRLDAGEIQGERITGLLAEVCNPKNDYKTKALALPETKKPTPVPQIIPPSRCPHCDNPSNPRTAEDFRKLVAYYQLRANRAAEQERSTEK